MKRQIARWKRGRVYPRVVDQSLRDRRDCPAPFLPGDFAQAYTTRFFVAADLLPMLETCRRQGRYREVTHRAASATAAHPRPGRLSADRREQVANACAVCSRRRHDSAFGHSTNDRYPFPETSNRPSLFLEKPRRPIRADALTELTLHALWKIDAPAHLSNIVPFHEREPRYLALKGVPAAIGDLNKALSAPLVFPSAIIGSV